MAHAGAGGGALRELFAFFQVEVQTDKIEKFENTLKGTVSKVRAAGYAIVEALALKEIAEFFQKQIEAAAHVEDLSEKLDVGAGFLRNFGFAAQEVGVDFESATTALGFLNRNIGEAVTKGGESAKAFARMRVPLKDSAGRTREMSEVLFDVAEAMRKMPDQAHRAAAAQEVFGREGKALLPVLAKGRGALEAYMKEAEELSSGLGDDFYKDAKRARGELEKLRFAHDSIKQRIAAVVLPLIVRYGERMVKLSKDFIAFTKRTNVLRTAMIFLAGVTGTTAVIALLKLLRAMGILKATVKESIAGLLRFAAPLAILWALYVVFDDLYTLMTGGQSVIGDTIDSMYGIGTAKAVVEELKAAWQDFTEAMGAGDDQARSSSGTFGALSVVLKTVADAVVGLAGGIVVIIGYFDDWITGVRELWVLLKKAGRALAELTLSKGAKEALEKGSPDTTFQELDELDKGSRKRQSAQARLLGALGGLLVNPLQGASAPPGQQDLGQVIPGQITFGPQPGALQLPEQTIRGKDEGAGPRVQQSNNIKVDVHVQSGSDPRQIGKAVGQGVATENEKLLHNALASQGGS